uniref:ARAD1C29128p n=1 Tax=Blastobotrys adeninivorans TaxID=409370 RepID=A0A060T308_BLAAD
MLSIRTSSRLPALRRQFGTGKRLHNDIEYRQHVFQPIASQSYLSPMSRKSTWLEAYHYREKKLAEWQEKHRGDPTAARPDDTSFSFNTIKTREVGERSREDSFTSILLPFRQDKWLLDAYINASGRLRIGQIFQDLDALAGVVSYKHCLPAEPVLVTASVDRIYMLRRLDNIDECNVSLSGCVTWSGRSSMEITLKAAAIRHDLEPNAEITEADVKDEDVFLTANFTFVARDPETRKSFPINHLVPRNATEKVDFVRAEQYNNRKKALAQQGSLQAAPPSAEESSLIHRMWAKQSEFEKHPEKRPKTLVNMADTRVFSTIMMQPQYRNAHSYMIFGGYLMRQTFELAYSCAAKFARDTPRFVSLDSVTFRNPVPVGSVLNLTAVVAYTEQTSRVVEVDGHKKTLPGTLIQVRVDSHIHELTHTDDIDTGSFTYSYFVATRSEELRPELLPRTYTEMMEYLEGRRKAIDTANFYKERRLEEVVAE